MCYSVLSLSVGDVLMKAIFSASAIEMSEIGSCKKEYTLQNILLINTSISFKIIIHLVFADLQLCETSTDTRIYKILLLPGLRDD